MKCPSLELQSTSPAWILSSPSVPPPLSPHHLSGVAPGHPCHRWRRGSVLACSVRPPYLQPELILHSPGFSTLCTFPYSGEFCCAKIISLPPSEHLKNSTCQAHGRHSVNACLRYKCRKCLVSVASPCAQKPWFPNNITKMQHGSEPREADRALLSKGEQAEQRILDPG